MDVGILSDVELRRVFMEVNDQYIDSMMRRLFKNLPGVDFFRLKKDRMNILKELARRRNREPKSMA